MATSQGSRKNKEIERKETMIRRPFDELFDNFRQDMEDVFLLRLSLPYDPLEYQEV